MDNIDFNNDIDNMYLNDMKSILEQYVYNLRDKDDIYKTPIFKGLLKSMYINIFKRKDNQINYNNKCSCLDYSDIDTICLIWEAYTEMCYKFKQHPTLLNFAILTGINTSTFDSWKRGEYRNDNGSEFCSSHSLSVKKWLEECEAAAYDVALSGNPGGMFILKCAYGYHEDVQVNINHITTSREPERIALDYVENELIEAPKADF